MTYNYFSKEMLDYLVAKFKGYFDKKASLNDAGLVTKEELPVIELTKAEYDALPDSKLTDDINYYIKDAGTLGYAVDVSYNNTNSKLEATNVQDAIDEIAEKGGGSKEAIDINYDNSISNLEAENIQNAIDEVVDIIDDVPHVEEIGETPFGTEAPSYLPIKTYRYVPELPITNFKRSAGGLYYTSIPMPENLNYSIIINIGIANWTGINGLFNVSYHNELDVIAITANSDITINNIAFEIIYV